MLNDSDAINEFGSWNDEIVMAKTVMAKTSLEQEVIVGAEIGKEEP